MARGLVDEGDVEAALVEQRRSRARLGDILVAQGALSEIDLVRVLAEQFGIRFVDLDDHVIDAAAGIAIGEQFARRYSAIGVAWESTRLVVAMANPADVFALDDIRTLTGRDIVPVMAMPSQISAAIDRVFHHSARVEAALVDATLELADAAADITAAGAAANPADETIDDAPVVRFVTEIIGRAAVDGASDLHVEPTRGALRIRFRVDGVLRDVMDVPRPLQSRIVSRIKIMASMDIADRRAPQDGRATMIVDGRRVDLRVVSFPTTNGEAVVIRLLDKAGKALEIGRLGFRPDVLDRYKERYSQTSGAIFVTGPTGSGKSTTLYATLAEINDSERNIITIEDPVEYELEGVKQVQVQDKAGVTFASALRSLLRADPDILLVGEVRDQDTAKLAIDAALTGHLVLTSLHTKSAAATPARLVKMGIDAHLVASGTQCVLAQRLARRLCDSCKRRTHVNLADLRAMGWTAGDMASVPEVEFFTATGCSACRGAGYKGRLALTEVMPVSDAIADAIADASLPTTLEAIAIEEGMVPLRRDGLRKAASGLISLEELQRVVS